MVKRPSSVVVTLREKPRLGSSRERRAAGTGEPEGSRTWPRISPELLVDWEKAQDRKRAERPRKREEIDMDELSRGSLKSLLTGNLIGE